MNNKALNHAYDLFVNDGYNGSPEDFSNLMATDTTAVDHAHSLFKNDGYINSIEDFQDLIKDESAKPEDVAKSAVMGAFYESKLPSHIKKGMTIVNVIKALPQIATDSEERAELGKFLKNRLDNVPEAFQSAYHSAVAAAADLFTADLDGLGYNEKSREWRDKAEKIIVKQYEELEKLEFKDTGTGIVAGAKEGDAASLIAGVFGAGVSMAETVIPATLTYGLSLPVQIAAPMYTDYNKAKAKSLYGDDPDAIEKLVENDQTEIAVPLALGAVATSLEYIGLKGVTKYIQSVPGKGTQLAKLMWVGSGEGFTEVGQLGTERLNEGLGAGKSIEDAAKDSWDAMASDEGLEMWLNGFLGATQISTAGSVVNRALRSDNASVKEVNDKINNLADLNNKKYSTRNQDVKDAINLEVKAAEQDLKNYINEKRKINEVLTENEKTSLTNTLNEKDNIKTKIESLKNQLEDGNISTKEFGYAIRGLNNQDKKLSEQLSGVQSAAITRAAEKVTETVKEQIKEAGLKGEVTEMTSEEISEIKEKGFDSKEASKQFGFIRQETDGSFEIILNKDKPMVGTAAHEFMHAVLFKTIGANKDIQNNLGDALVEHTQELGGDKSILGERLSNYGKFEKDGTFIRDDNFGEETITIMSESIIDGSLKFEENFFTKIGNIVRRFSQNYLGKEITFDTGRDVYNFVKDYSKSIKDGKISPAILKVAKEGIKGKLVEGKVEAKPTVQMSKAAAETVNKIYKEKGVAGAGDIAGPTGPYKKMADVMFQRNLDNAPTTDIRQNLLDNKEDIIADILYSPGTETAKARTVLGLVQDYPAYVEKQKKAGKKVAPLSGFINNMIGDRAKAVYAPYGVEMAVVKSIEQEAIAKEVEKIETKPQDVILTERVLEQYKTPLLSGLTFVKDQINVLRKTVSRVVGTKLSDIDAAVSKNRSVSPLIADMKAELYVKNGPIHKMVYDIMSEKTEALTQEYLKKTNPKTKKLYTEKEAKNQAFKDSVEAFFKNPKYKKAVLESLTTTWLAKHLPMGVEKKIVGVGWSKYDVWKGRKKGTKKGDVEAWQSSEEGPYKGMTDGKQKIRRNPKIMGDITPAMLGSAFIKGETITDVKRGGLENISLAITQELGIETFKADMINDGALKKLFTGRQELFNRILDSNFVEEFVRQTERGTTKFSKSKPVSTKLSNSMNEELAKKINKQASYNNIVEIAGHKPINIETDAGRSEYLQFFVEKVVPLFPKKVLLAMSGTFARGDRIYDKITGMFVPEFMEKAWKAKYIFANKADFEYFLNQLEEQGIRFGINLTEQQETNMLNAVTRVGYGTVSKKTQQKKVTAKEQKASKKTGFKLIWKMIQDEVQADKNTIPGFAAMLSSSSQFQGHMMRTGAGVNFYNLLMGKNVEEHTSPITALGKFLFINAIAGNLFTGKVNTFDNVMKSYFQGSLPTFMDHRLKKKGPDGKMIYNYSDMPPLEHLAGIFNGDISVWARYFHPNVNGNFSIDESVMTQEDIKKYKDIGGIDPNIIVLDNGQTVAELFGVEVDSKLLTPQVIAAQQDIIYRKAIGEKISPTKIKNTLSGVGGSKFSRSTKNTQTMTKAINFSRSSKNPTKGMSAWDFDDTIARTKSGVRYTLPNPEGTPQPSRKVIFMAGGPGSGKSTVIKGLDLKNQGFKIVNQDISLEWLMKNHGLPTDMRDFTPEQASTFGKLGFDAGMIAKRKRMKFQGKGDGIIIDGTGNSLKVMENAVQEFKNKGYDVQMVFVETSLETALERNRTRKERSLKDKIVTRTHESVQNNKKAFQKLFGDNFAEVKTDNLKIGDAIPTSIVNKLDKFTKGYIKGRLDAGEYAHKGAELEAQGATFDFSEFDIVKEGEKGPLWGKAMDRAKKYGLKDNYILTARPHASKTAIYRFLDAQGLNIPFDNIITLENSTSESKALWIAEKVGEGYNDIYFADDAMQNVQAVQNMLDQFDVKGKTQQAKVKFSKSMNTEFNNILEDVTGIESKKRFSAIKARKRGADKGKFRFFIPPSHEDFVGLLYNFMGKGKKGDAHRNFFEQALVRPLNRAYRELNTAKQAIANDYKSLNKEFENVKKKLTKKTPDGDFTYQDAIRVYLFDKHGHKVPGLNKTDQQKLVDLVMEDSELQTYAETLNIISKQETYVNPTESWEAGDIRTDLDDATGRVGRKQFFTEFNENAEIIFSEENLNKIEAAYGEDMVSAIKDILYRTKTGRNRPSGQNKQVNQFMNWLNGSVASTMFFNMRSAVLQQMSMVNFINFADNNVFSAAKAFASQPQYWKDWATIFNSDFMKQRRGGIKTDVNGAELAASLKGAKNTPRALLAKLLQLGFLPTQIGDNMAIATGGSTFYRNRINTYLKQGMTQKEAESKAWVDFQVLAEATQQSARPDMVSQQQASPLGKVILAFQNVTSQFNRLGKKAFLDIKNRRITPGNTTQFQSDISNLSRIGYYFAIQNLIFYSLQSALFLALFEDDEDDEKWLKKKERVINGSIDSVLRGTGIWGAVVATLKNMAIKRFAQEGKNWNADPYAVMAEALQVSPPLGIKARKMVNAEKTLNYNKKVIDEMETFDIDNPMWSAYTSHIEGLTNIPLNRLYNKTQNIRQSLNNQHEAYQRALMFGGWSQWNLGIENERIEKIKETLKREKEKLKKKKKKKKKTNPKTRTVRTRKVRTR